MSRYIHKVHYYETDKMGITHHSNYIRFMEEARMNYLNETGFTMARLEAEGITSPVVSVTCDYKYPSTYDDEIEIERKSVWTGDAVHRGQVCAFLCDEEYKNRERGGGSDIRPLLYRRGGQAGGSEENLPGPGREDEKHYAGGIMLFINAECRMIKCYNSYWGFRQLRKSSCLFFLFLIYGLTKQFRKRKKQEWGRIIIGSIFL